MLLWWWLLLLWWLLWLWFGGCGFVVVVLWLCGGGFVVVVVVVIVRTCATRDTCLSKHHDACIQLRELCLGMTLPALHLCAGLPKLPRTLVTSRRESTPGSGYT